MFIDKNGKEIKEGMLLMFFGNKDLIFKVFETIYNNQYIIMNNRKYFLYKELDFKDIEIVGGF